MNWLVDLQQIQWREPLWLYLALLPLVLHGLRMLWRRERISAYADKRLIPWVVKKDRQGILQRLLCRNTFYSLSWILFSMAAAGPRMVLEIPEEPPKQPVDIFLVVDVSQSMHTMDVVPNRLKRAKNEILELINQLHKERVGIIVYSARPHLYVPLTYDYSVLPFYVKQLDSLMLPTAGSQLADALSLSLRELNNTPNQGAVVLITDGDINNDSPEQRQQQQQKQETIAAQFKQRGIHFSVLGIGTIEGDAIPKKAGGWLQHEGRALVSRMQEDRLQMLAELSGGAYSEVQDDSSDWDVLYSKNIRRHSRSSLEDIHGQIDDQKTIWLELYQWLLLPALILFMVAVLPYRWTLKTIRATAMPMFITITVGIAVFQPQPLYAGDAELIKKAYQSYSDHNYQSAQEYYAQITGYLGRFGEGASRYAAGQYNDAITQFTTAALQANSDQEIAVALYNLANSYFQTGNYATAVDIYNDSLRYRPEHPATIHNLELSKALKKIVERRSRLIKFADRAGRGTQQAIARQNMLLNESDSVTLDQSEDTREEPQKNPLLSKLPDDTLALLIEKGIKNVQLITTQAGAPMEIVWKQDVSAAKMKIVDFADDGSLLWQRIFEIKEGIEAPLDEPLIVPGVAPW